MLFLGMYLSCVSSVTFLRDVPLHPHPETLYPSYVVPRLFATYSNTSSLKTSLPLRKYLLLLPHTVTQTTSTFAQDPSTVLETFPQLYSSAVCYSVMLSDMLFIRPAESPTATQIKNAVSAIYVSSFGFVSLFAAAIILVNFIITPFIWSYPTFDPYI